MLRPATLRREHARGEILDMVDDLVDDSVRFFDELLTESARVPATMQTDFIEEAKRGLLGTWALWVLDAFVESGYLHEREVRDFLKRKCGYDPGVRLPRR